MLTNQQVIKRLRDEFNEIESKCLWNVALRVSTFTLKLINTT